MKENIGEEKKKENKTTRIDIRDLGEETLKKLDEQKNKYGMKSRTEYIKLLINLDILTNMVNRITEEEKNE